MSLAKFTILFLLVAVFYSFIIEAKTLKTYTEFNANAADAKKNKDFFTALALDDLKNIVEDKDFNAVKFKTSIDKLVAETITLDGVKFDEAVLKTANTDRIIISCIDVLTNDFIKAITPTNLEKLTLKDAQVTDDVVKAFLASQKLNNDLFSNILSSNANLEDKKKFFKYCPIDLLIKNIANVIKNLPVFEEMDLTLLVKENIEKLLEAIASVTDKPEARRFASVFSEEITKDQLSIIIDLADNKTKIGKEFVLSCFTPDVLYRVHTGLTDNNKKANFLAEHGALFAQIWKHLDMNLIKEMSKVDDAKFTTKIGASISAIKDKLVGIHKEIGCCSDGKDKITKEAIEAELKQINDAIEKTTNKKATDEQERQKTFYKALSDAIVPPTSPTCPTCQPKGDAVATASSYAVLVAGLSSATLMLLV